MPRDDPENAKESRMTTSREPTTDDRRRAVCAAMGKAPSLVRYAARYTASLDDAEDVYQRAMEIALTKAPTVEADAFLAWLYTVVRHEALAVIQGRRREPLGISADIATAETPAGDASSPERIAEWRERHRGVRDALDSLSEQQRTCVMLQSTGLTYDQIATLTGFSRRQIERSIARGRRRLAVWEEKLASGAACEQLRPILERILHGEASQRDRRRAAKHTAACAACRASMVHSHALRQSLAGLVPIAVLAGINYEPLAADPVAAFDLGERVALGAAARLVHITGPLADLPVVGLGRVGAGVGAIVIAFIAAMPLLGSSPDRSVALAPQQPERQVVFGPKKPSPVHVAAAATPAAKTRAKRTVTREVSSTRRPTPTPRSHNRSAAAPTPPVRAPKVRAGAAVGSAQSEFAP